MLKSSGAPSPLKPGETAYVSIPTGHAEDALLVPNAAMTVASPFPPEELDKIYKNHKVPPAAHTTHAGGRQVVWRLAPGDRLEPIAIRVGISDYASSQVLEGDLKAGDSVVTAVTSAVGSSGRAPIPGRAPAGKR